MIGNRLQLAREAAGLSLRALSDRLGNLVTAQAIAKYEKNRAMPGSPVLLALCRALNVSPAYLLSEREIALEGIEFRKAATAGAKQEKAVQARVLEQLERYLAVEEALAMEPSRWQASLPKLAPIAAPDEAQAAAQKLREHWKLGDDPIPSVTELLEEHGIKVIAIALDKPIFGSKASAKLAGDGEVAAILVNQEHTGERQRFTLAHELGHLMLSFSKPLGSRDAEKAMDRFAGAFLVPEGALRVATGERRTDISLGELVELKKRFLVSLQTLVVRLKQTHILSDTDAARHWRLLEDRGFLKEPWPEPEPVEAEKSHRLHRLAMRAVTEGALSDSRAAELLGISVRELDRWLDEGAHADAA
jgi:Zn-dependent peptidase ImmA (M78 family)/transcriptional regulator with XRE-family HTH domain